VRKPTATFLAAAFLLIASISTAQTPEGGVPNTAALYGHVETIGPDGQSQRLPSAQIVLLSAEDPGVRWETSSDSTGAFSVERVPAGRYTLTVRLENYQDFEQEVGLEAGVLLEQTVTLALKPVRAEVTVRGTTEGIQPEQTTPTTELQGSVYNTAPLVSERFLEALPLVPGVLRGPDGLMKIKGAPSTQTGWLVNSANVTDPVTGEQAINLPVDVIQEVEVLPNPYAAEYGKFSGAVTSVTTTPSSNKFKFSLNNFVPRLRWRDGHLRGLEAFTPRLTLSGPLVKERLTFLQSFEYRLNRIPVLSLPELEQDTDIESFDSFTQFDLTLNPNHRLTTVFSLYPEKQRFATLNTFNPQPVTANYRQRGWMAGLQDRWLFGDGSLLESTFSMKEFDVDIFPASVDEVFTAPPHCNTLGIPATTGDPFTLRPQCNFGSFFNTQNRISRRYEWLEVYSFAPRQARGQHWLKLGINVARDSFRGVHQSHRVEVRRTDGTLAEQIDFVGNPTIARNKTEFTVYLHDKWNVNRRLTFDLGARYDYDTLAGKHLVAPRLAFAYVLTGDMRTLLRGGVGLFYDKVPLNVGTFPQLQQRVETSFASDGVSIVSGPLAFGNLLTDITNPRSLAFNLEFNRELAKNLLVRIGYLQREGRDEYLVEPFDSLDGVPTLELAPRGRSRYREFQLTANYSLGEEGFLNASYVHSESAGDLNLFSDYFDNFENPIIRSNQRSRLDYDVPDRFVTWGDFKTYYGIHLAPVLEIRSGFPFSLLDEEQNFVGARNQGGRFPVFSSLDLHVYRTFKFKAFGKVRTILLGIKVFNLFNHFNPRDVQQNVDAFNAFGLYNSRDRIFRGKFSLDF
jgi:hypothetical protein